MQQHYEYIYYVLLWIKLLCLLVREFKCQAIFSNFLIPATLLNLSIFLLIAVVMLWISSLPPQTLHCPLSSLIPRFHPLIIFLFSVNSIYNHNVLLFSNISHSGIDAIYIPRLFVTFSSRLIHNTPSTLSELVDSYNFILSLLHKHAPLKTKAVHSRPSQPWFTSQLHSLKISFRKLQRIWARTHSVLDLKRLRSATNRYILFILYTSPQSTNNSKSSVHHHLYADDTQLFISFSSNKFREHVSLLENAISEVSSWTSAYLLMLNPSKTEFLLVGLPKQLSEI
jgi:Reverse transcriptase (RNA-dependent DNA polymerase)